MINRFLITLLPLSLLAFAQIGCSHAAAGPADNANAEKVNPVTNSDKSAPADKAPTADNGPATAKPPTTVPTDAAASGLDRLCNNHYNAIGLPVDKYEAISGIIDKARSASVAELKDRLNAKEITLNEASWGLYYLGQKSLGDNDFKSFVKYLTAAADDYLNPWAMTLLAKVYYYDKDQWKKQYPQAEITTDKDLEKSYVYLSLGFVISGEIEKDHHDNAILTGVTNGGLALKDTFEGTGVQGFDPSATLKKNEQDMLAKAQMYKTMYDGAK